MCLPVLLPGFHQEVLRAPLQSSPPLLLLLLLVRGLRPLGGRVLCWVGAAETLTGPKLRQLKSDGFFFKTWNGVLFEIAFQTRSSTHLEESLSLGDHVRQALGGRQVLAQVPLVGSSQTVLPATRPAALTENLL